VVKLLTADPGTVVKLLTADPGTASSTPSQEKYSQERCLKNLVCHVRWAPLVHVYCTMDQKNIQYVRPEAECECPSVSLNNAPTPSV